MKTFTDIKPKDLYIVCKLPTVSLSNIALLSVLNEHDVELYQFSDDIFNIVKSTTSSDLYLEALKMDLTSMAETTSLDIDEHNLHAELSDLIEDIMERLSQINIKFSKLKGLELQLPDTVIFRFVTPCR